VVYDLHHDRCNPSDGVGLGDALATWPTHVRPKAHLSSPRLALPRPRLEAHADFVAPWDLRALLTAATRPLDVMVEAKAKDLAVLWLRRQADDDIRAAEEKSDKSLTPPQAGQNRGMAAIAKYTTVPAPVDEVYSYWRDFTNFPRFMPHVKEVAPVAGDDSLTHWKVDGPLGVDAEWEARITEDVPNEKIAWASVEGSRVENSGVVRFDARDGTRPSRLRSSTSRLPARPASWSRGCSRTRRLRSRTRSTGSRRSSRPGEVGRGRRPSRSPPTARAGHRKAHGVPSPARTRGP
jgi:uncharacterized membrane protein